MRLAVKAPINDSHEAMKRSRHVLIDNTIKVIISLTYSQVLRRFQDQAVGICGAAVLGVVHLRRIRQGLLAAGAVEDAAGCWVSEMPRETRPHAASRLRRWSIFAIGKTAMQM